MVKVLSILSFLLIVHFGSYSQNSINDYKYIIVPTQYEFLKEKDQYQLNSLTKFLFNKYGYTAFLQDEALPQDLLANGCLALTVDLDKDSGLFKTKLQIHLRDCNGQVVHSSQVGQSREKEFAKAYNLALRDAFTTFQNLEYSYQPNDSVVSQSTQTGFAEAATAREEIEMLKEEIKNLKEDLQTVPSAPVAEVAQPKAEGSVVTAEAKNTVSGRLYAQPIENGFQLVDSTPKVVMILLHTGVENVFSVKDSKAIVFKKDGVWMCSEDGGILNGKPLDIKF